LHGWRQEPVAIDLETRLSELGLSAVQIVDYRNFAHGRHYGFVKAMAETTVVAVSDMADRELARSTLSVLPDGANVVELSSGLTWPLSTVDLLVGSMHIVGDLATGAALDPANPRVPSFGRRLYHLSVKKQLPDESIGAVDRKLATAGVTGSAIWRERYAAALGDWLDRIGARRFKALVLDYDGTMCDTNARTIPLPAEVCAAVVEVLSGGLLVGVASGRGRSLLQSLRSWIPQDYWAQVYVGLYNGGVVGRLDEEIAFSASADPNLAELAARLQDDPLGQPLECELRPTQLSVGASGIVGEGRAVEVMVRDAAARTPALPVRIVRSGHSVDVISEGVSKQAVLSLLADLTKGPVLAIGDQGQAGGNDHALLAADESSLSVDRCSADPTRCWNLLQPGEVGPAGLLHYLRGLHVSHGRARFSWKRNA
jgi:hypothetical protein